MSVRNFILRQQRSIRFEMLLNAAFDNRDLVAIVKRSTWHHFDYYTFYIFDIPSLHVHSLRKIVVFDL